MTGRLGNRVSVMLELSILQSLQYLVRDVLWHRMAVFVEHLAQPGCAIRIFLDCAQGELCDCQGFRSGRDAGYWQKILIAPVENERGLDANPLTSPCRSLEMTISQLQARGFQYNKLNMTAIVTTPENRAQALGAYAPLLLLF